MDIWNTLSEYLFSYVFSFGSFLTCLANSFVLLFLLNYLIRHVKNRSDQSKSFFTLILILLLFKIVIPINFPWSFSIRDSIVLGRFVNFARNITIPSLNTNLYLFVKYIWFFTVLLKLFFWVHKEKQCSKFVKHWLIKPTPETMKYFNAMDKYFQTPYNIAIVSANISLAIFGIKNQP